MPAFVSLSFVTIIMSFFFFLLIIKNFTGVFLSTSHLHLKNSIVKSYKLQTGEETSAPGSDVAAGVVL